MEEVELNAELARIGEGLKLFDLYVHEKLNERQVALVSDLLTLFRELNWQVKFNQYKTLSCDSNSKVLKGKCGVPVKVRSCREGHDDKKTYFGILLGDMATAISHTINQNGNVVASFGYHNPAIFVPELKTIIFGHESWWGEIESEEEMKKLITDEVIQNAWYVKVLTELAAEPKTDPSEKD